MARILPVLLATGCGGCNDTEFAYPAGADRAVLAEPPADVGSWLSMEPAPDGRRLTIAYYDRDQGALAFAIGTPLEDGTVSWVHEPVDGYTGEDGLDRADRGMYASHAIGPDGTVWIAYYDVVNGGLYVARRPPGEPWVAELVDAGAGDAGRWASLALGADGSPIVAHHDGDAGSLRVSRLSGSTWSTEEVAKGVPVVVTDPDSGEQTTVPGSIGVQVRLLVHDGGEYLAAYDAAAGDLVFWEGGAGSWTSTVVDEAGDVGQWPSLWTDGDTVRIAYHDAGNQNLKVATRTGGAWTAEVVDAGEYRGADTEIFESDGELRVVYFDGYDNDLLLATLRGGAWEVARLGGEAGAVGFHNEVAEVGGRTWVASYDYTARGLFLTTTTAGAGGG